ncbi:MAG: PVC-type heme-binding CxxCH protein, partial [Pirellulaceae bacterium]
MNAGRRWAMCIAGVLWFWCGVIHAQGYSLEEAVRRMTVADGFHATLVAGEPHVRQPILVKFDDRGRLWVIQYLQYPNPAGLQRVEVDRYSRTIYDRVPKPPPQGPRGADRITICEDIDGDGRADKFTDFVDGLNLATGIAFGHGGVFVLQVPYLLFYPDRDRDDIPDSDPEVLLTGFGMGDAQSLSNHLTWGPDGWLYGLNGSTTTCNIRGIKFQQGVWRYHPMTRRFELFCEGGGNGYGLDFDHHGNLFYSSNGSHKVWHGIQGAYYWKQFSKHGELRNPYAFGYFGSVKRVGDFRGGHVTTGGSLYYGDTFPGRFRGKLFGNNLLSHEVHWHTLTPAGSTFETRHGGELLLANDLSFAPTDLTVGPDGAVYVCDFHDKRTAHPDPDAEWEVSNGRVYRIQAEGAPPPAPVDLNMLTSNELVDWLSHSNAWYVRRARRILAERRDSTVFPRLRQLVLESQDDTLVLQALWALYVSGGFDDDVANQPLRHRSPPVRS